MQVLTFLGRHPSGVSLQQMSAGLGVPKPSLHRILSSMRARAVSPPNRNLAASICWARPHWRQPSPFTLDSTCGRCCTRWFCPYATDSSRPPTWRASPAVRSAMSTKWRRISAFVSLR
ncbi:helix-turn-helix domain-containing protein [Fodinicola feengrottensis]|uniref:helix-turn-helix domain-containing protein n=1 Tax=Fodinicola feengrottensis TaxID=435914 RepID=UPI0036F1AE3C